MKMEKKKKLESVDARAATVKRRFRTFQLNGHQHRKFAKSGEKKKLVAYQLVDLIGR